jgi:hypothetical protein
VAAVYFKERPKDLRDGHSSGWIRVGGGTVYEGIDRSTQPSLKPLAPGYKIKNRKIPGAMG